MVLFEFPDGFYVKEEVALSHSRLISLSKELEAPITATKKVYIFNILFCVEY
jgi:hypothetical protein